MVCKFSRKQFQVCMINKTQR